MIDNSWAGAGNDFRYDLWEPRLQLYGDTAIVSYTFMLSVAHENQIVHRQHNESRVLIKGEDGWKIVHVHKSPAWNAPYEP
jgi:ketosteroid isomerase-like protein